jgi:hypothetical protein
MVLKRTGEAQSEIQKYVDRQESLFYALRDDVENNKLEAGVLKEDIVRSYGEPVIEREVKDKQGVTEELLYRHPTRYFTSDRIYLYFSNTGELVFWEYFPQE